MLLHFLLDKYEKMEPILRVDLQKVVRKKYKAQFPDILKRASTQLNLVYGLEMKKGGPKCHSYILESKVGPSTENNLCGIKEFSKKGLLMTLLSVIFMKGNHATEDEVWEFLNVLGIQAGKKNIIFVEPRNLILTELVEANYLEYHQVPGNDSPCFEFLWGPRAHAETTKMKVLEFLSQITGTTPSAFPSLNEEALREKAERAEKRAAARAGRSPKTRANVRFKMTD
uniref:melanoma-associated antigen B1-like n=1 Tax=Jaculus jaculus TaxID=51337 RepID=UPI001E1B33AA|nr:melanoma-associated antigen B1-like [Jaculus jaculus]